MRKKKKKKLFSHFPSHSCTPLLRVCRQHVLCPESQAAKIELVSALLHTCRSVCVTVLRRRLQPHGSNSPEHWRCADMVLTQTPLQPNCQSAKPSRLHVQQHTLSTLLMTFKSKAGLYQKNIELCLESQSSIGLLLARLIFFVACRSGTCSAPLNLPALCVIVNAAPAVMELRLICLTSVRMVPLTVRR